MTDYNNSSRRAKFIVCFALLIFFLFIGHLFYYQIIDKRYRDFSDSNAFYKKVIYPSRGLVYDRKGKLLVANQQLYDVMITFREMKADFDTIDFCNSLNISMEDFKERISKIKDRKSNPGYSSYTPQILFSRISQEEYLHLLEKLYKFEGVHIQKRSERNYKIDGMGTILGYISEVNKEQIQANVGYVPGEYIGKSGIESKYESVLRGEKGYDILLRDARGRIQGKFEQGVHDVRPKNGKDIILTCDSELQKYGAYLMKNKVGSIVMIDPTNGEILCMVSSPDYDPALFSGKEFSQNYVSLYRNPYKPLINRAISGAYPPGSTFKTTQGLIFLKEGIIDKSTIFPCHGGFPLMNGHPHCHSHAPNPNLIYAITTSCNSYFPYGLWNMLGNPKYGSTAAAFNQWKDYLVSMGFGYRLGVDLPSESRGFIPNPKYYNKMFKTDKWKANSVISVAIGQGEVLATPLQLANLSATIANRGFFYTPHIVKQIENSPLDSAFQVKRDVGIDREYYELIVQGMRNSVLFGTSKQISGMMPELEACGKTGTSQNPHGEDHSIFIAFAPKDNPKVAVCVVVENGGFGATNALPIASLMMKKYLNDSIPPHLKYYESNVANRVILPSVYKKGLKN